MSNFNININTCNTSSIFHICQSQTCVPTENNDNEDAGEESDTGSTNSSHRSANNNLSIAKLPDPMSCLALDKVGDYVTLSSRMSHVANIIFFFQYLSI